MEKLSMYYFDLDDDYVCLIKDRNGNRFTAGRNKEKVQDLIKKLNKAHRPNVEQVSKSIIKICWNNHERSEGCEWEIFDFRETKAETIEQENARRLFLITAAINLLANYANGLIKSDDKLGNAYGSGMKYVILTINKILKGK